MDVSFEAIRRRLGLEPQEGRLMLLMAGLVAMLLCAYTIAKVLRDALFLTEFDAVALPYMYVGVAVFSAVFVWLETIISKYFNRVGATRVSQLMAIGFGVAAAVALPLQPRWTTLVFYIWTGSQAMMLLPHFWLLALEVWDSRRARRLFPILSGFGLIGGLIGGAVAVQWASVAQRPALMWMLVALLIACHALTLVLQAYRARNPTAPEAAPGRNFWDIIRRSSYIKVLAAGLALSVLVSTLVDFQFKFLIEATYTDPQHLTQFLGRFYVGLNVLALLFQFGAAGWLLQRLGLGASTGLQPATVMLFASVAALSTGLWAVVALRWIQGVVFQTLGKSSSEIYFAAIPPVDRRRVKPAIDTLVERWSDAAAGLLLLLALRVLKAPPAAIAIATAILAAMWLIVLVRLNQEYGRAFKDALSSRWLDADTATETIRTPSARKALLEALHQNDARRTVLALRLSERATGSQIGKAVRECLQNESAAVRLAAIQAMEARRLPDRDGQVKGLLQDPEEGVRRAVVGYLLTMSRRSTEFSRQILGGDDAALHRLLIDAMWERPYEARGAITLEWVDARLSSGTAADVMRAARALGTMSEPGSASRLKTLIEHPDIDVQRAALLSAARRPSPQFLEVLVPRLLEPEVSAEARQAMAAIGDAAVPILAQQLEGANGAAARDIAARTLARMARPRGIAALMTLVRSAVLDDRCLGLRSLARARGVLGRSIVTRRLAHRLFLRELRDYRFNLEPALGLETHAAPEVRLLAESFRESSESALERALLGLACYYDPRPLFGAFHRLRSRQPDQVAAALEFLSHELPRGVFRPVERMLESRPMVVAGEAPDPEKADRWIRTAWESGEDWLMACAVRAARHLTGVDLGQFTGDTGKRPMARSELESLAAGSPRSNDEPKAPRGATMTEVPAC